MTRQEILEEYDTEFIFLEGEEFDTAILGVASQRNMMDRIAYSVSKILEILKTQGMSQDEAQEYFDFNILGAYMGEATPLYVFDNLQGV